MTFGSRLACEWTCVAGQRLSCLFGINAGELYLRQHDRHCVPVDVFLWGAYYKSCCLSVFPRAHRVRRVSKPVWLRLAFYLVGVGCFGYA